MRRARSSDVRQDAWPDVGAVRRHRVGVEFHAGACPPSVVQPEPKSTRARADFNVAKFRVFGLRRSSCNHGMLYADRPKIFTPPRFCGTVQSMTYTIRPATCSYRNCRKLSTAVDAFGSEACAFHAAMSEQYVVATAVLAGRSLSPATVRAAQNALAKEGWDVAIRAPHAGESEGVYVMRGNGTLQLLGGSGLYQIPPSLDKAIRAAAK